MPLTTIHEAIGRALRELDRAGAAGWRLPDGTAADAQLERLRQDLAAIGAGTALPPRGLVRWVMDWIPDVNDPLVAAVAEVERRATAE